MTSVIDGLKARRSAAKTERDEFDKLIQDAYDYSIPYRRSAAGGASSGRSSGGKGEKRVDKIFDDTAVGATFRGAGRLQQDLWPTNQDNFKLAPGPLIPANDAEKLRPDLERVSSVCGAMLLDGEWDQALSEMCIDLQASTGLMLILKGTPEKLARFISVPLDEVILEGGPYNDVSGIFWTRKWSLRAIAENWPRAKWDEEQAKELDDKPATEIDVHQDTVWDAKKKRWILTAWSPKWKDGKEPIATDRFRACPWLTPRYYRVPGEVYGRGPIMLAMGGIKTLNTAQKITLQAAAIAMLGIYLARDDGVFNPDVSPISPGVFWKVASTGGNLGASVTRFPDPNIQLSNLVLNDLRMGVKSTMNDQQLPPDNGAVRSASEIIERVKRLASDHIGAYGRLVAEIVIPLIKRLIEIAYDWKLIPDAPPLDQLLVKVQISSPLAKAREASRVQAIVQALEMEAAVLGPTGVGRTLHRETALTDVYRALGVEERHIVTDDQRKVMDDQAAAMAAAQMAAEAAPEMAAAAEEEAEDPAAAPTPEMMVA